MAVAVSLETVIAWNPDVIVAFKAMKNQPLIIFGNEGLIFGERHLVMGI
jgi:ABC-type Fe3+-hydroxamate transport system substrate-binding protein